MSCFINLKMKFLQLISHKIRNVAYDYYMMLLEQTEKQLNGKNLRHRIIAVIDYHLEIPPQDKKATPTRLLETVPSPAPTNQHV